MLLALTPADAAAAARVEQEARVAASATQEPPGPDASPAERLAWVLAGGADGEG